MILALIVYHICCGVRKTIPLRLKLYMIGNIIADFIVGLCPLFGDLLDMYFRANSRNVTILRKHLGHVADKEPVGI